MARRMRAFDWASTPLGPMETWPPALLTAVSICLDCAFPIFVWWGPELVMLYNDEYVPILGPAKHPSALGQPGAKMWPEIWDVIGPMLAVMLPLRVELALALFCAVLRSTRLMVTVSPTWRARRSSNSGRA